MDGQNPIEVVCPVGIENYVLRLTDVGKKEFKKFRELLIYYSPKGRPRTRHNNVTMKVG
jgi:hypothetical protein